MDTIFTISGIFFLYNFLVRFSGITGNGVHRVQKSDLFPHRVWPMPAFLGFQYFSNFSSHDYPIFTGGNFVKY